MNTLTKQLPNLATGIVHATSTNSKHCSTTALPASNGANNKIHYIDTIELRELTT